MISVAMIAGPEPEPYIKLAIDSVIDVFDEVVIVLDPDKSGQIQEDIESFNSNKIRVLFNNFSSFGEQKQYALDNCKGDYVLFLDSDEVLSDDGYKLKNYVGKGNCFSIKMVHFIRDFGHVDSTFEPHYVLRRAFKREADASFKDKIHEIVNFESAKDEKIDDVIIYHLGYLKGIETIIKKYCMNILVNPAHKTTVGTMKDWLIKHLFGNYPVRPYDIKKDGELPQGLLRWMRLL